MTGHDFYGKPDMTFAIEGVTFNVWNFGDGRCQMPEAIIEASAPAINRTVFLASDYTYDGNVVQAARGFICDDSERS